jgi:hypothetical protein
MNPRWSARGIVAGLVIALVVRALVVRALLALRADLARVAHG